MLSVYIYTPPPPASHRILTGPAKKGIRWQDCLSLGWWSTSEGGFPQQSTISHHWKGETGWLPQEWIQDPLGEENCHRDPEQRPNRVDTANLCLSSLPLGLGSPGVNLGRGAPLLVLKNFQRESAPRSRTGTVSRASLSCMHHKAAIYWLREPGDLV